MGFKILKNILFIIFTTNIIYQFCFNYLLNDINNLTYSAGTYDIRGKTFNSSYIKYLKKLQILSPHKNNKPTIESNFSLDTVFLLAATENYYESLRATIYSIQKVFGNNFKKIIVYDLGKILFNKSMTNELKSVCKLELKIFDFNSYPEHIQQLDNFGWKILMIAENINKYNTIVYCDTSVYFLGNDFRNFFNKKRLIDVQMTKRSNRGIRQSTHPGVMLYLPLNSKFKNAENHESSMIILKQSNSARELLKWAVLCALEPICLISASKCQLENEGTNFLYKCSRIDQSIFSILINNAEQNEIYNGNKQIITHQAYNHPSKIYETHIILKKQSTLHSIDKCGTKALSLSNNFTWKDGHTDEFYEARYKMSYCMALENLDI